jgi:hypothetical protein
MEAFQVEARNYIMVPIFLLREVVGAEFDVILHILRMSFRM